MTKSTYTPIAFGLLGGALGATIGALLGRWRRVDALERHGERATRYVTRQTERAGSFVKERAGEAYEGARRANGGRTLLIAFDAIALGSTIAAILRSQRGRRAMREVGERARAVGEQVKEAAVKVGSKAKEQYAEYTR